MNSLEAVLPIPVEKQENKDAKEYATAVQGFREKYLCASSHAGDKSKGLPVRKQEGPTAPVVYDAGLPSVVTCASQAGSKVKAANAAQGYSLVALVAAVHVQQSLDWLRDYALSVWMPRMESILVKAGGGGPASNTVADQLPQDFVNKQKSSRSNRARLASWKPFLAAAAMEGAQKARAKGGPPSPATDIPNAYAHAALIEALSTTPSQDKQGTTPQARAELFQQLVAEVYQLVDEVTTLFERSYVASSLVIGTLALNSIDPVPQEKQVDTILRGQYNFLFEQGKFKGTIQHLQEAQDKALNHMGKALWWMSSLLDFSVQLGTIESAFAAWTDFVPKEGAVAGPTAGYSV
ncbi:unnamed protein product [Amoebophrya sp. A25]|nr:unnamed protein product [Amoebophrya sp. A25]|eukprot:GSA25T00017125001.1